MKKIWILSLLLCLPLALTACQQVSEKKENAPIAAATTVTTTNNITTTTVVSVDDSGTGGDLDSCDVHQFFYHAIAGDFTSEQFDIWIEMCEVNKISSEDQNIVTFVRLLNISREDFPRLAGWTSHKEWDGDMDKPALSHYKNCPYTYNQFLDAIYGDDPELTERVFSAETVY